MIVREIFQSAHLYFKLTSYISNAYYFNGRIDGEDLRSWVFHWPPSLWKDFEPLLNYCRDNGVRLVACGTPLEVNI